MLKDYQQRLIDEFLQLEDRIKKLNVFMTTDDFYKLNVEEQNLMFIQIKSMLEYKQALLGRLAFQKINAKTGEIIKS